jgi:NADH-quinone oxidoreductase subunit N
VTPPEIAAAVQASAYRLILPEIVLLASACLLFVVALAAPLRGRGGLAGLLGLGGVFVAGLVAAAPNFGGGEVAWLLDLVRPAADGDAAAFARTLTLFDPTGAAGFVRWLALGTAALVLLLAWPELADDTAAESVACLLCVAAGTSLCGRANDLVSLFLSLELLSIPTYVLLMVGGRGRAGQEAAVKYFLLSVLSSGILLFGFSYLYGLAGSTNLGAVVATLTAGHAIAVSPLATLAAVLVVAGLGFRVTAVPFHFYAPDVYQGAPAGVAAVLATAPKLAGFVALARLLGLFHPAAALPFDANRTLLPLFLWAVAVGTMTLGNVMALLQSDLRRLLAYSGVAHGGYMLIGLVTASAGVTAAGLPTGSDAVLIYLVAYTLMTAGAFAVLTHLGEGVRSADDLAGLGETHPVAAGSLAVCLVSLIGLPLTAGFVGKFVLFVTAFTAPTATPMGNLFRVLAVVAAVNAAIGAVYYLRLIGVMYLRSALHPRPAVGFTPALLAAVLCAAGTLAAGVYPKPVSDAARVVAAR